MKIKDIDNCDTGGEFKIENNALEIKLTTETNDCLCNIFDLEQAKRLRDYLCQELPYDNKQQFKEICKHLKDKPIIVRNIELKYEEEREIKIQKTIKDIKKTMNELCKSDSLIRKIHKFEFEDKKQN
uniref:Uncharacterized protein n=1 Tax=uncultured marine virus TaxID=186617 RepID=A0A0F7L7H2_9VIRU|nr:hypothetical protein [uncultured marine virus]